MEQKIDDLKHIRSLMERSTKFLSLSGMSGVSAGVFALLGALAAYYVGYKGWRITHVSVIADLALIAVCVLILASASGLYFSLRKARRSGAKFWMPVTRQILVDFTVPMVAGGLFCGVLVYHHCTDLAQSAMLIFYGLALFCAGARTYRDIKVLGACEIVLGILAGFVSRYGLLFWAIGFGVLHILYGIIIYYRYDAKSAGKEQA